MHYIFCFIQSFILLLLSPLLIGVLRKLKAFLRGFHGPSIFQMYYDIYKLFSKEKVVSNTSSFVTYLGPILSLSACATSIFFIPVFYAGKETGLGNIFIVIFLFAVMKLFITLIGLDSASAFGGMGSSRELFISAMLEPIIFVSIAFLFFETKSINAFCIANINSNFDKFTTPHIIACVAFFIIILAENTRMPVDNPETHLELTMIHEAMILDLSGSDLALMELASSIKLTVLLTLFINCFIPFGIATSFDFLPIVGGILLYVVKIILCLFIIALLETSISKFRLFRLPELLACAFAINIVALVLNYFM